MEWDPIQNMFIQPRNNEHFQILQQLNNEIDDHILFEEEYNEYLNSLFDGTVLELLNKTFENFESDKEYDIFQNWEDVSFSLQCEVFKLFNFRVTHNLEPEAKILKNLNKNNKYFLKIANILYKIDLYENLKNINLCNDSGTYVSLSLSKKKM